ncbi:MAG: primosomal protein N', partial [Gammaproteobacteria bacterium]|nr:primosomal protein N' [Gammaproteobacteria bacterium]
MKTDRPIVRIAIPAPSRRSFDYWAGKHDLAQLQRGCRVRVPFGSTSRVGVVLELTDHTDIDVAKLRPISATLDTTPTFSADLLGLLTWAADYYHHPIGEVIFAALPAWLRQGRVARKQASTVWALTATGRLATVEQLKRAPKQAIVFQRFLEATQGVTEQTLAEADKNWRNPLNALRDRGWIERTEAIAPPVAPQRDAAPTLSSDQAKAVSRLEADLNTFSVHVLEGITGSGKTEVYLRIIERVVRAGKQALLLVPEIGLTPQTLERVRQTLPFPIGQMHSGLSDGQRMETWMGARDGSVPVLVGTRSAVFAPFKDLGLIIVDEEHDLSYKQQDGFRYSARDIAVRRAQQLGVPIVLGSATPSFETLRHCSSNRYQRIELTARVAGASLPAVKVLDVRSQKLHGQLSPRLLEAITTAIGRGEQSLLFVNQRGYAPVLMCHDCAWVGECARCDSRLVWHRRDGRLRCHHCQSERPAPARCPECESDSILPIGSGTERIVEHLEERFPNAAIARIDRDSTRRRGAFENIISEIQTDRIQILVGTQMLAKGHHFPNVTLVGIVDVDGGLFGADFRAPERMAQLIVQVAGRAGRGRRSGTVYLQTHHPEHPILRRLIEHGYQHFAKAGLEEREPADLPPFTQFALLRAEAAKPEVSAEFLVEARELALSMLPSEDDVAVLGPVPAPMERRGGRFRAQLLLQAPERRPLHALLGPWLPALEGLKSARRVRWSVDV